MKTAKIQAACNAAAAIISAVLFAAYGIFACADGSAVPEHRGQAVSANVIEESVTSDEGAKSIYVCEMSGGKELYEKNSGSCMPMGHFAKLMTVLMTAEAMEDGSLSADDVVTVSSNANSKQGTQIWLDAGEKITVDELLRSITIGNANDANTALGERLAGSEEKFVEAMNKRSKKLGMKDTFFADCCGTDSATVSTAHDISLLCRELSKHEQLTEYFTVWIDRVRNDSVELVSTNRLIRTCKGLRGGKACSPDDCGESVAAWSVRGDMGICAVVLGTKDQDGKFSLAQELFDAAFSKFTLFSPEIDKEYLEAVRVTGGEKLKASVKIKNRPSAAVPAGSTASVECKVDIKSTLTAPVKKGDIVGTLDYTLDGKRILKIDIVAAENVGEMTFAAAFRKNMLNLFNLHSK